MTTRKEKRRLVRKKARRKSRLSWERGTERIWMEMYCGDPRRLRLSRRQGSRRHMPKSVREMGVRGEVPSSEDLEFLEGVLRGFREVRY